MPNFNYRRRNLGSGIHFIGALLLPAGLLMLASPLLMPASPEAEKLPIAGIAALAVGLIILLTYPGTLIDFSGHRAKEYQQILGIKLGNWEKLPPVTQVRVAQASYFNRNTPNGISPTLSGTVTEYNVMLLTESQTPALVFTYSKQNLAHKKAQLLAGGLGVGLVLASVGE